MSAYKISLNNQEKQWILERRFIRLTDNKEVQIYPMGAERYLATHLLNALPERYSIKEDIKGKDVLVIPGYGTSGFLFAQAGASSITIYDKDPVTIAWVKAFKKYYHYREFNGDGKFYPSIGELLTALTCWYLPLISLPSGRYRNSLFWCLNPNLLRRAYIHYMVALVHKVIHDKIQGNFEWDKKIYFHAGTGVRGAMEQPSHLRSI